MIALSFERASVKAGEGDDLTRGEEVGSERMDAVGERRREGEASGEDS